MSINKSLNPANNNVSNSMFIESSNDNSTNPSFHSSSNLRNTWKGGAPSPTKNRTSKFQFNTEGVSIFFGKAQPILRADDKTETLPEETFGPIILNPKDNNLYKAWEKAMVSELENYKDTQGKITENAKKVDWITRNPGVLCFQIRRAVYNKEKKKLEKTNQLFTFDKEIHIDRFMLQNKDSVERIRYDVQQLESRIEVIQNELKSMSKFGPNQSDLADSLRTCLTFIQTLQAGQAEEGFPSRLVDVLRKDYRIEMAGVGKLLEETVQEKARLLNEKRNLETQITSSYGKIEESRYRLFSIIMHDGTAEYGHYYAFIRDGEKWFKFNDFHVKEVSEEEVFSLAYGGEGTASAYCVFYVSESLSGQENFPTHQLLDSSDSFYSKIVPVTLLSQVKSENKKYQTVSEFVFEIIFSSL